MNIARRVTLGVTLGGLAVISLGAGVLPGSAVQSRAASIQIDEPATTTTTAAAPAETPIELPAVVKPETTTTTAPVAAPATPPVKLVATPPAPKIETNPSGHYVCFNMDAATQYDAGPDCKADVTADPGPNNSSPNADPALPNGADGDQPGHTLGSTDDGYGADLTTKSCQIKPWLCGNGWTH